MPYIQFISSAAIANPDCLVVFLSHFEDYPPTNEAPFVGLSFGGGGPVTGAFGSGVGTTGGVVTDEFIPSPELPFNGDITVEYRLSRVGGFGGLDAGGTQNWNGLDIPFTINGDTFFIDFGTFGSAYPYNGGTPFNGFAVGMYGPSTGSTFQISIFDNATDWWTDDAPHAVAFALHDSNVKCFVDGVLVGSVATPQPVHSGSVSYFGYTLWAADYATDTLMLDEMRITLNEARYTGDYTPATGPWLTADCDSDTEAPPSGPASTLLLKFDSGLLVDQNSTRVNTLTTSGSPTAVTTSPQWGTHCAEFNSISNENIDVQSPGDFKAANGEATIDFWFNPTTAGDHSSVGVALRNALFTTSTAVPVQQTPSNNVHLWWWWNTSFGGWFGLQNSGWYATGVTAGVWHHVRVCFYTTGELSFWLDGSLVGGTPVTAGAPSFDAVSIGNQVAAGLATDGSANSYAWQGRIDSVRILTGTATDPKTAPTITVPAADFDNV